MPPLDPTANPPVIALPDMLVDLKWPVIRDLASRIRFSPTEGRIWLDERRMVLLGAEAFSALREEILASLGTEVARGLFTRIGYAAGCRDADMAWRIAGPQARLQDVIRAGALMHGLQGFVMLDQSFVEPDAATDSGENFHRDWTWKNSIEDEGHIRLHGVGNHAVCWNEVGYSSGYLSTCLGRRILVREIECRAMGNPHCRNVAKPVEKWTDAEEDLRYMEPQPLRPTRVFMGAQGAATPAAQVVHAPEPLPASAQAGTGAEDFVVGASTVSHLLRHKLLRVAPTQATVLLLGESGVGKSLVSREVHRLSLRADQPFVEVNCAAIPEQLIESELFGVERGAYSGAVASRPGRFEAADGGTLFLDEIATLSMTAQGKLLRVLQSGQFERLGSNKTLRTDVRVIAATNEDLKQAVRAGRFREDLFFRLNVFPLLIQPLRERRDDIPLLASALLERFAQRHRRQIPCIAPRAMQALMHQPWPGNVRQLENVLERGVILAQDGEALDLHHLFSVDPLLDGTDALASGATGTLVSIATAGTAAVPPAAVAPAAPQPLGAAEDAAPPKPHLESLAEQLLRDGGYTVGEVEEALTRVALKMTDGNVSRAAPLLGFTRSQLDYRLRRAGPGPR